MAAPIEEGVTGPSTVVPLLGKSGTVHSSWGQLDG
jgi:hypothetical protein